MAFDPISIRVVIQDGDREVALMGALQQVMAHFTPADATDADVRGEYQMMRARAADWLSDRHSDHGHF